MATIGSGGLPRMQPCTPTPMEIGILLFNSRLKPDSKKRIGSTAASNRQHLPCSFDSLLKDTVKLRDRNRNNRSVRLVQIENAILNINRHAKVVDVLIQQQPDITAIVWGGLRFLIGVAAIELEASEKISETLVQVSDSLGFWNKYIELFDDFESVRDAAARLFSYIIDLLVHARTYYQKNRSLRFLKVGFTAYSQRLSEIMSLIHEKEDRFEREATQASRIKLERDRKTRDERFLLGKKHNEKQDEYSKECLQSTNKIQDNLQKEILQREENKLSEWLHKIRVYPRLMIEEKGTCTWIRKSHVWLSWEISCCDKPLCIFGVPGSGKSTIGNFLSKDSPNTIVASHFFQATINKDQSRPEILAAGVLYDLLQHEAVKSSLAYTLAVEQGTALSRTLNMTSNTAFQELWRVVLNIIANVSSFLLIVDGLDECDEKYRDELCLALINLASQPNARVIVLFRLLPSLDEVFHDCPRIELSEASIAKDIELYLVAQLKRYPETLGKLPNETIQEIRKKCQGMFLYAEMMMTSLKDAETYEEESEFLEQAPKSLYGFFEKSISSNLRPLNPGQVARRRMIFAVLVGAREPLTCEEISVILGLQINKRTGNIGLNELRRPKETILKLCWPLVRISNNYVHFIHGTVESFVTSSTYSIKITSEESEASLASRSLAALSKDKYRSPNQIAILIRQNVAFDTGADDDDEEHFYGYAANHWFIHLTAVRKPENSLVQQANRFLHGNEFVSWSEYLYQTNGSQGKVLEAGSKLEIWKKGLSDGEGDDLVLVDYFSGPYLSAAKTFEKDDGDKTLQYLCLYQLGEYYNLATRTEEAFQLKKKVANGLVKLLGERHPLALKAQSAFALEYLGRQQFPEAEMEFNRLAKIQKEVLGTSRPDCFQSLQRQAMAELWMTKFLDANTNLIESLSGFLNTVGVKDFLYLMSELTLGQVLEYQGQIDRATLEYKHIWTYRSSILGPDNSMALWARCALVSTYRKMGRYEDAHKAVDEVIDARTRILGSKLASTVDAVIQKALLFLDEGLFEEAMEVIDFLLDGDLVDKWFERLVQVDHVRALLEIFTGKTKSAIKILQSLVDQSAEKGDDGRVRSLLWVRLDLATILRREGRSDEATKLFDDLVTSADYDSSSSWDKMGFPAELGIAEKALRLVRDIKSRDADLLLEKNGLKWVRQKDFWILNGSPPADTAWMKRRP